MRARPLTVLAVVLGSAALLLPGGPDAATPPGAGGADPDHAAEADVNAAPGEVPDGWLAFALPHDDHVPPLAPGQPVALYAPPSASSVSGASNAGDDAGAWPPRDDPASASVPAAPNLPSGRPGRVPAAEVASRAVVVAVSDDRVTVAVPVDDAAAVAGALAVGPVLLALRGPSRAADDAPRSPELGTER